MYERSNARWAMIILGIFAVPALYIGLWSFKMFFHDYLWAAHTAQKWPQVQAKVLDIDWKLAGSRTGAMFGHDMQVVVHYQYEFQSLVYKSNQVGFERFAARNENMYHYLQDVRLHHGTVTAWVNPENPEQAVLDIRVSWLAVIVYVLVAALFTTIGGGLMLLMGRTKLP